MDHQLHPIYRGLQLILAVALLFVAYYFNNVAGEWKNFENIFFFFFGALGIVFLVSVGSLFSTRKIYNVTALDVVLTVFAIYVAIRTVLTNGAFWENESFLIFITLYAICFVYKQLFADTFVVKVFLVGFTSLGLLASSHGILQGTHFVNSSNLLFSVTGAFVNPQVYGGYLASLLPFTVALHFLSRSFPYPRIFSYFSFITTLLLLVVLAWSQSRAAWLASAGSIIFFLQKQYPGGKKIRDFIVRPRISLGVCTAVLLLLGLIVFLKLDSAIGRLLIWKISLPMWGDNFLFGVGYSYFKIHYLDYQAAFFSSHVGLEYAEKIAGMTYYTFNEFLQIAIELGFIGLMLYFSLLLVVFTPSKAKESISTDGTTIRTLAQSSLISILIFSLFSYPFSVLPLQLHFFVSLALLSSTMSNQWAFLANNLVRLGLITITIACVLLSQVQWKRYQATKQWKQAAFAFSFDEELAISRYEDIYPTLAYKGEFLYNYGAELAEANYPAQSIRILEQAKEKFNHLNLYLYLGRSYQKIGENTKAEQAYQHAADMIPHRFLPRYLLVKLYQESDEHEKAVSTANVLLNMEEKVPSSITRDIKNEMKEFLLEEQL